MPKIPKISGNKMIRYLQGRGFVITRRKGSHVTLRHDDVFTTIPAGNRILKTGTMLGVLSDVGINKDEFVGDHRRGLIK